MKKLALLLIFAAFLAEGAFAQSTTTTPHKRRKSATPPPETQSTTPERSGAVPGEPEIDGCGLGWQVTDKKTIIASVTRGTTNSVVPPSFGMSSGTLGCAKADFSKRDQEGVVYALSNYEPLSIDMAQGHGEYLEAFARTLGCNDAVVDAFGRMTQAKYGVISAGGKATPVQAYRNLKRQIQADPVLSRGC